MSLHSTFKGLALALLVIAAAPGMAAEDSAPVHSDEILLKNGSRIIGTVTGIRDGVVKIDTDFAGSLEIGQDQISGIKSATPVVLRLNEDAVAPEQPLVVEEEQLIVVTEDGASHSQPLVDLVSTNPEPWELGRGYQWTGLASLALGLERGNTDTEELDYRIENQWLGVKDRYTVKFNGEVDKANDVKSADNWNVIAKYDRFLEGPWYWGMNAAAKSDEFADLDLRYWVGPYAGRKFFDEPILTLEGELGLVYVNEDFITAPDEEYPGANWNVHLESNYLGDDSRLYIDHIGIWDLDDTSNIILNTTFGVAFPLVMGLEGAAEVLLEYDSGAVEGVEDLDQTYRFRVGYTW